MRHRRRREAALQRRQAPMRHALLGASALAASCSNAPSRKLQCDMLFHGGHLRSMRRLTSLSCLLPMPSDRHRFASNHNCLAIGIA